MYKSLGRIAAAMMLLACFWPPVGNSAVTYDGSIGPHNPGDSATQFGPTATATFLIGQNDGSGTEFGENLFHSFSVFNLSAGQRAFFTAQPVTFRRVISRVTGGSPSQINGEIRGLLNQSTGAFLPGVDFYFMNPSGVVFGPGGVINVNGTFHVARAGSVEFTDGNRFLADTSPGSTLTMEPVEGFGFVKGLELRSTLNVGAETTLSLVGESLTLGSSDGTNPGRITGTAGGTVKLTSIGGSVNLLGGSFIDATNVDIEAFDLTISDSLVFPGFLASLGAPFPQVASESVDIDLTNDLNVTGSGATVFGQTPGIRVRAGSSSSISNLAAADIDIEVGGTASISGSAVIRSERFGPGAAGNVTVKAVRLEVTEGASIAVSNFFAGAGGDLMVVAKDVLLSRDGSSRFTGLTTQSDFHPTYPGPTTLTAAAGGTLRVHTADSLTVRRGAEINSDSFSLGRAGDILVTAGSASFSRDGANTGSIASQSSLAGRAGDISVGVDGELTMSGGFRITATTSGVGDSGNINVSAGASLQISDLNTGIFGASIIPTQAELDDFAKRFSPSPSFDFDALRTALQLPADAGLVEVFARLDSLGLTAVMDATAGNAGDIVLSARTITVQNKARVDSSTVTDGRGGSIRANADNLNILGGAKVRGQSGLELLESSQVVAGRGDGGRITLQATDRLSIAGDGSSVSTSTLGPGDGGSILLAADTVSITAGGELAAESFGTGFAGNISVDAGTRILLDDGNITTRAKLADGGDIALITTELAYLHNSTIATAVESGVGGGGNIFIDPQFVVLQNSSIIANAFGGPGGNIKIVAGQFIVDPQSVVEASSQRSIDGVIEIDAPDTDVSATVAVLPESLLDATALLRERCGAARTGAASSLSARGRGGIPVDPDGYLPSLGVENIAGAESIAAASARRKPLRHVAGSFMGKLACSGS